jgi:hypothetical protein
MLHSCTVIAKSYVAIMNQGLAYKEENDSWRIDYLCCKRGSSALAERSSPNSRDAYDDSGL